MNDTPKTKTEQLRETIEKSEAEIRQAHTERAIFLGEGNREVAPITRERVRIETQITALKEATDEDLAEMGLSRKDADQKRRALEDELAAVRVRERERTAYWQERVNILTERIEKAAEVKQRAEDRLALYA